MLSDLIVEFSLPFRRFELDYVQAKCFEGSHYYSLYALSFYVHTTKPGTCVLLHCDFHKDKKEICIPRSAEDVSSDWIWSRSTIVDGKEGYFEAKMYHKSRQGQYIERIAVSRFASGISAVMFGREDRTTPPYRGVNTWRNCSIALRKNGVQKKKLWLIRPEKSTRSSWDDPPSPSRLKCLVVELITFISTKKKQSAKKKQEVFNEHCQQIHLGLCNQRAAVGAAGEAEVAGLMGHNAITFCIKFSVWKKFYIPHSIWI